VIALGLLGSVLLAVGAFGVGAVPASLDDWWLPASSTGRGVSYALCAVGVLLLLAAWWGLRSAGQRSVLAAAGAWALPLLVAPPLFSRDVFAYAGQAHLVVVGLDPYTHGPADAPGPLASEVDDVWADAESPYGPVFLRLAAGMVALTGDRPMAAAYAMRLLAVVGAVLVAWALPRLARAHGMPPERALWLGLANPLLLLHGIAGAHNDLLMVGLLVAGLALAPRIALAAAVITLAALVKAPAAAGLLFLPFLAERRLRAAPVVAVTASATAALVTLATRLGWGWLTTLDAGSARRSLLSPTTGVGVALGAVDAAHVAGVVLALLLSAFLLIRADRWGPVRALGLALLAVVALGPVVQPWYLLWGVVVLAAVAGPRTALFLGAGCAVLCLLVLPSGRHLIRPPLYGVPLLVAAAVALVVSRPEVGVRGAAAG
jgi:hypothetical protein